MAQSNALADRDQDFNTRIGSMRGWQMALERVKPILRAPARVRLSAEVLAAGLQTPRDVVAYFSGKYFSVELAPQVQQDWSVPWSKIWQVKIFRLPVAI